jgi:hypothetical protein
VIDDIDQNLGDYERAEVIAAMDFSEADFRDIVNDRGQAYGKIGNAYVPIAQPAAAPTPAAPTPAAPQPEGFNLGTLETILNAPFAGLTRGVAKVIGNAAGALGLVEQKDVDAFFKLTEQMADVGYEGNPIAKGIGTVSDMVGQYVLPAATGFNLLRAAGASKVLASIVAEGMTGLLGLSPNDENLFNMISKDTQNPVLAPVRELLATDPNDREWTNRARNATEALLMLGLGETAVRGLISGIQKAKDFFASKQGQQVLDFVAQAGEQADARLDSAMSGTTLSANPIGAAGDMALSAAGKVAGRAGGKQVATDLDPQGFFSAVSRAVDAIPMEKGTGAQMRAMIAKGEGVKAEEMAWTGLDDFLAGKQSVTKQEVRDFVDANQVQIEEVTTRAQENSNWQNQVDDAADDIEDILRAGGVFSADAENALTNWQRSGAQDVQSARLIEEYMREAGDLRDANEILNIYRNEGGNTKFSEYTLPGGENYREVLLTMPNTRGSAMSNAELARLDELTDKRIANSLDGLTDAERDEYIGLVGKRESRGQFRGGHFDEPNVLAHIRLNDRTGPNGEKILFVEEIQSDWHQKGRKQGYQNEAVPDAPLKKTWHEMSFRRVARIAAEEGYDAIAWTPGEVQADRYDLSKHISRVYYRDGTLYANDKNNRTVMDEDVDPENIDQYVGKEIGDKIRKQLASREYKRQQWATEFDEAENGWLIYDPNGDPRYDYGGELAIYPSERAAQRDIDSIIDGEEERIGAAAEVSGLDLKVGGEGMKGFYDKMLKSYAEKWGKKFGSKVGVTKIEAGGPASVAGTEVWSMPVTPKMRDSVLKRGVPLFSAAGATAVTGAAMQNDNQPASERVF